MTKHYRTETFQGRDGLWYVRIRPLSGGRTVFTSEGYVRESYARKIENTLASGVTFRPKDDLRR